ncbi:TraE/TraK family type IV conjugative transfer system protein [Candidatus Neptunochlamydia vexilliferae]|uniref:Type IV conjugative transfer system protein TraE n=1 Tax=Candidatus Neptunichlamydia vexilliferae TaxID=1651774 RepID=A0ABS0B102_9BACT|nr:TraE/TraK family type IV conjugative transfer system protein [Candidatus Neptunochlamydia vexilliferae]MBF5060078.1 hypothetical protein [Candidatus Neptunochlamydia vexilliferae]
METKTFQKKLKTLASQRNVLALCIIALSLAVIKLSFAIQNKEERVVIIPTTGPSFWVEKSRTSKEYLNVIGTYLSDLLLTRTPSDISWKNQQILCHAHPSAYVTLKKALLKEKETLTQDQATFVFKPIRSYASDRNLTFVIEGIQKTYIEKPESKETLLHSQKLKYTLSFRCEEGRLYLTTVTQEKL